MMETNISMTTDHVAFTVKALIESAQSKLREVEGYDRCTPLVDVSMVLEQASRLADALGDELGGSVPVGQ